ncbi:MAG: hypothetical protein FJY29_04920 [Betaproteobacteria bacterium]|nr:hypothetical protein [Betaproteobacteria bacterium]
MDTPHLPRLTACVLLASALSCIPRAYNSPEPSSTVQQTTVKFALQIHPDAVGQFNEFRLRQTIAKAFESFERSFGAAAEVLDIAVGGQGCLRTGYQFESKKVVFCNNTNTRAYGTDSEDVIHHEVFHALLCRSSPELCTPEFLKSEEKTAIHEAFADVFAHALNPDESFGENFYKDLPFVRKYRTRLCYSMLEGEHAKGNALVSALLESKVALSSVADWLKKDFFTVDKIASAIASTDSCLRPSGPRVEVVPLNAAASKLNRYRVGQLKPLQLSFRTNPELLKRFPSFEVRWPASMQLFRADSKGTDRMNPVFEISTQASKGWEKVTVEFWSETLLASRALYLAVDSEDARSPTP